MTLCYAKPNLYEQTSHILIALVAKRYLLTSRPFKKLLSEKLFVNSLSLSIAFILFRTIP